MPEPKALLNRARLEARDAVMALSVYYEEGLGPSRELRADFVGKVIGDVNRAIDLVQKVARLEQAERDFAETNATGCEQGCMCCADQYEWLKGERDRLRRDLGDANA